MRRQVAWAWAFFGGLAIAACGSSDDSGSGNGNDTDAGADCAAGQTHCFDGATGGDASANDSGAGQGDSRTFDPTSLSGLFLWSAASDVVTDAGPVGWPDLSGNGRAFFIPSGGPTYVESSTIAGGPAIRLEFANNDELRADLGNFTSDDYVIELVANTSASSQAGPFLDVSSPTTGTGFLLWAGNGQAYFETNEAATSSYANVATHVVGVRVTGGTATLRVDGAAATASVSSTPSGASSNLTIGWFDGDVAEIVMATHPSSSDVS
ncbi:MAG: hypothetical protein ACRELY_26265 [Polyangiaceae bacterium]